MANCKCMRNDRSIYRYILKNGDAMKCKNELFHRGTSVLIGFFVFEGIRGTAWREGQKRKFCILWRRLATKLSRMGDVLTYIVCGKISAGRHVEIGKWTRLASSWNIAIWRFLTWLLSLPLKLTEQEHWSIVLYRIWKSIWWRLARSRSINIYRMAKRYYTAALR